MCLIFDCRNCMVCLSALDSFSPNPLFCATMFVSASRSDSRGTGIVCNSAFMSWKMYFCVRSQAVFMASLLKVVEQYSGFGPAGVLPMLTNSHFPFELRLI